MNGGVLHLEHFHSYQTNKKVGADNNSSNKNIEDDSYEDREEEKKTIEFHTDQGFFVAFTPGMIVSPTATQQEELPCQMDFIFRTLLRTMVNGCILYSREKG